MSHGRRLTRGDRRRNGHLEVLRGLVPREHAVLAIDLASDKQVFALIDHDSKVLARRTVRVRPWQVGSTIEWGRLQALACGFSSITVACEPTGNRWKVIDDLTAQAGLELVCVQPLLVARAREAEDFTRDKSDDKDALLIGRLTTQLHVYRPERATEPWARLRQLGARRHELTVRIGAARQQVRDLLELAWPAGLNAAAQPLDCATWLSVMTALDADPTAIGASDVATLTTLAAQGMPAWGARRVYGPVLRALHAAAQDTQGDGPRRAGTLERVAFALDDLRHAHDQREQVHARMIEVLHELDLTALVTSIPGLSAVGAATILAETGDLHRYASARALVKHAGLAPRENSSGHYAGRSTISGRGRPLLRTAAWRAVWGALSHNPVMAARYQHLRTRTTNPLSATQARVALAGALLRQLHAVVTTATPWDPTHAAPHPQEAHPAA